MILRILNYLVNVLAGGPLVLELICDVFVGFATPITHLRQCLAFYGRQSVAVTRNRMVILVHIHIILYTGFKK